MKYVNYMKNVGVSVKEVFTDLWDGVTLSGQGGKISGGKRLNFFQDFVKYDLFSVTQSLSFTSKNGIADLKTIEEKSLEKKINFTAQANINEFAYIILRNTENFNVSSVNEQIKLLGNYLMDGGRRRFSNILGCVPLLGAVVLKFAAAGLGEIYSKTDNSNIIIRIAAAIILKPLEIACRLAGNLCHSAKAALDCATVGIFYAPFRAAYEVAKYKKSVWEGAKTFVSSQFSNLGRLLVNAIGPVAVVVSGGLLGPILPALTNLVFSGFGASAATTAAATHAATVVSNAVIHTKLPVIHGYSSANIALAGVKTQVLTTVLKKDFKQPSNSNNSQSITVEPSTSSNLSPPSVSFS